MNEIYNERKEAIEGYERNMRQVWTMDNDMKEEIIINEMKMTINESIQ